MRYLLAALSLVLAAFSARADIVDIDNAELARLTAAGVPVIDVRTAQEWQETGIVPGSRLITFFDEQGRANPAAWLEKAKAVAKPGEPVAVICRSGNRTKAVSRFLSEQAGYAKVYNVKAGILGWTREGRPVVPAAPALAACRAERTC
ncbi:MAG: rhodanese-like domain-containing protein [Actinomycetota bacterium]